MGEGRDLSQLNQKRAREGLKGGGGTQSGLIERSTIGRGKNSRKETGGENQKQKKKT